MTEIFKINDFHLFYKTKFDGGGTWFGQDYLNLLSLHYKSRKFNRCLDWCSGPGFIGISLLVNNLCNTVSLMDANDVFDMTKKSLNGTQYKDKVTIYNINKVQDLPSTEIFDLIVGNPPHFNQKIFLLSNDEQVGEQIFLDTEWKIHNEFFNNIKKHLANNGVILLQESQYGCNIDTFNEILDRNNLKVSRYFKETKRHWYPIFYLEITHK